MSGASARIALIKAPLPLGLRCRPQGVRWTPATPRETGSPQRFAQVRKPIQGLRP